VIAILLILLALGLIGFVVWCAESTEAELQEQQRRAELSIDRHAESAKRAMNDAAGQSWRNLVD
jgi:type II secretory pathway pseudopilin PulG